MNFVTNLEPLSLSLSLSLFSKKIRTDEPSLQEKQSASLKVSR